MRKAARRDDPDRNKSSEAAGRNRDARAAVPRRFFVTAAADLFHPIVHQNDIWKQDPFDVESIHAEARAVFHRLLSRAAAPRAWRPAVS